MASITINALARQIIEKIPDLSLDHDIQGTITGEPTTLETFVSNRLRNELIEVVVARKPSTLGELASESSMSGERLRRYLGIVEMHPRVRVSPIARLRFTVIIQLLVEVEALLSEAARERLTGELSTNPLGGVFLLDPNTPAAKRALALFGLGVDMSTSPSSFTFTEPDAKE